MVINYPERLPKRSQIWEFPQECTHYSAPEIEEIVEGAVLQGKIVLVDTRRLPTDVWKIVGIVPLRWGAPRVLLLRFPKQIEAVKAGQEIRSEWRLWRYRYDPSTDMAVTSRADLMRLEP